MSADAIQSSKRVLDPIDRIAEILFGLIMVLTFTGSLSAAEAGRAEVRTMLIGALGCNLAWGVIDGVLYLMGCLAETGRSLLTLRAVRAASSAEAARPAITSALPQVLSSVMETSQLDEIWLRLKALPEPPAHARLAAADWLGALGVFALVTLSICPVAIPFAIMDDAMLALRVSNGIAIAMMFAMGWQLARITGRRPWAMGAIMVVLGIALVALAIALGG